MTGIYLHIPFCRKACHYCNFHFSTSVRLQNDFVNGLLKEVEWRKDYLGGTKIDTIYLGGGTPSLLSPAELEKILNKIYALYPVDEAVEITLEANPDDLNEDNAASWKATGINRLSIGIQSFHDADLKWMNRSHDAAQACKSVTVAQRYFNELSIDLIYGTPELSDDQWMRNLEQATASGIAHLSCYALTVEPRTALEALIKKNQKAPVQPESQARQFMMGMDFLEEKGYEHYEISNLALPGHRSKHNSGYWNGMSYLGLGPSAHSYDGLSRQWNMANNALYISGINAGNIPHEKEILTPLQQCNEFIMTRIRTREGIDPSSFESQFGQRALMALEQKIIRFVEQQHMMKDNGRHVLTREGKLFADGITAALFFEELPA